MKPEGVIRRDESYRLDEFKRRVGMEAYALTQARRDGLRVIAVGKKIFVRGCDWLEYLDRKADED